MQPLLTVADDQRAAHSAESSTWLKLVSSDRLWLRDLCGIEANPLLFTALGSVPTINRMKDISLYDKYYIYSPPSFVWQAGKYLDLSANTEFSKEKTDSFRF